jgi:hypothetical protein
MFWGTGTYTRADGTTLVGEWRKNRFTSPADTEATDS